MDDENIPVEKNLFESRPAYDLVEEVLIKTNAFIAEKLLAGLPEKALLRRQARPQQRRLDTFGERMNRLGYKMDISSSAALQTGLFHLEDAAVRMVITLSMA